MIRNPQVLDLLAGSGLVKADLGRETAMASLRKLATSQDLARFEDAFTAALDRTPTPEALLLVARAKPAKARDIVDRLAKLPNWRRTEELRIARAALGAEEVENQYLATADGAKDGPALANALYPLSLIGTTRSLKAIAGHLRTPWTINMPGAYEKSVRLNVIEALLYNFPDQPIFNPNNINAEADYTAAEQFCARTLGVFFHGPPPPFLTYRGYPIPQ